MSDIRLIYQVVEWERRLQIEEETRRNLRGEPYSDGFAAAQPASRERQSIFSRIFGRGRNRSRRQPTRQGMTEECCG